uniref:carbonic anhydrase n=1 Tax=Gopherus evgoodei TaxID=1825980 RepID=A0A8C4VEQ6_9SAUR
RCKQWGWAGLGPEHWHKYYPIAKGDNQSPIEINSKEVHYEPSLLPWFVGYDPVGARTIVNNGRTCKVVFDDTFNRSVLRNGPLPGIYRLRQLHFHWGSSNDHGSDFTWYTGIPNTVIMLIALRNYDGVAILGIFLQVSRSAHSFFVLLALYYISVYLFKGKECVTWILLRELLLSMAKLRSLSINADTEPARPMVDNWRPPQPRHFRMVRASFQ